MPIKRSPGRDRGLVEREFDAMKGVTKEAGEGLKVPKIEAAAPG